MNKKSIVVIPGNVPWNWSTDYINQTAKILSKRHTVICFYWLDAKSIKQLILSRAKWHVFFTRMEPGIIGYFMVHLLPFYRFAVIYNLNLRLNLYILKIYIRMQTWLNKNEKMYIWFFDPICFPVVSAFRRNWTKIYDCVDYFRGDIFSREQKHELALKENMLIKQSDIVVVNSSILRNKHNLLRKDIYLVPQGFREDEFLKKNINSIKLPRKKPIIGYVGAINYRLDFPLLEQLIKTHSEYEFIFVGPYQESRTAEGRKILKFAKSHVFTLHNVIYVPEVKKSEIKGIINQFDIGIIPYRTDMSFNVYSFPMKLFEYFYMGKPVVSSPIDELKRFPKFVSIADSEEEWKTHITRILSSPWPSAYKREQKRLAVKNSWKHKIDAIERIILMRDKIETGVG